jgi:hypothetical protein
MREGISEIIEKAKNFALFRQTPILVGDLSVVELWSKELLVIQMDRLVEDFIASKEIHIDKFFSIYTQTRFKGVSKEIFIFSFKILMSLLQHKVDSPNVDLYFNLLGSEINSEIYQILSEVKFRSLVSLSVIESHNFDFDCVKLRRIDVQVILSYSICTTPEECLETEDRIFRRLVKEKPKKNILLYRLPWLAQQIIEQFKEIQKKQASEGSKLEYHRKVSQLLSMRRLQTFSAEQTSEETVSRPNLLVVEHEEPEEEPLDKLKEKDRLIEEIKNSSLEIDKYKRLTASLLNYTSEVDILFQASISKIKHINEFTMIAAPNKSENTEDETNNVFMQSIKSLEKPKTDFKPFNPHNVLWNSGYETKQQFKQLAFDTKSTIKQKIKFMKSLIFKSQPSLGFRSPKNISIIIAYFKDKYKSSQNICSFDLTIIQLFIFRFLKIGEVDNSTPNELVRVCSAIERAIDDCLEDETCQAKFSKNVKTRSRAFYEFLPKFKAISDIYFSKKADSTQKLLVFYQQLIGGQSIEKCISEASMGQPPTTKKEDTANFDKTNLMNNSTSSMEKPSITTPVAGRIDFPGALTFRNLNSVLNSKRRTSFEKEMIAIDKDAFTQFNGPNKEISPKNHKIKTIYAPETLPYSLSFKIIPKATSPKNETNAPLIKKNKNGLTNERSFNPFTMEPEDISEEYSNNHDHFINENNSRCVTDSEIMDINQECEDDDDSEGIIEDIEEDAMEFNKTSFLNTLKQTISDNILGSLYKSMENKQSSDADTNKYGKLFSDRRQFEEVISMTNMKESPTSTNKLEFRFPNSQASIIDRAKQFEKEICDMMDISKHPSGQPEIEQDELNEKPEISLSDESQPLSSIVYRQKSLRFQPLDQPKKYFETAEEPKTPFYKMLMSNSPRPSETPEKDRQVDGMESTDNIFMKRANSGTVMTYNHSHQSINILPSNKDTAFHNFNSFRRRSRLNQIESVISGRDVIQTPRSSGLKVDELIETNNNIWGKGRLQQKFIEVSPRPVISMKSISSLRSEEEKGTVEVHNNTYQSERFAPNIEVEDILIARSESGFRQTTKSVDESILRSNIA